METWVELESEVCKGLKQLGDRKVNGLYAKLERQRLNGAVGDLMIWRLDKKGAFQ